MKPDSRSRGPGFLIALREITYSPIVVAALELYFDPAATRRLRTLWTALDSAGVQSLKSLINGKHRPHLSLVGAPELDGPAIAAALAGMDVSMRVAHTKLSAALKLCMDVLPVEATITGAAVADHARGQFIKLG